MDECAPAGIHFEGDRESDILLIYHEVPLKDRACRQGEREGLVIMAVGRTGHAFTLIELLVVVAIISLLISILLPSLRTAKELARRAVCAANQHQWALAFQLYAPEYDDLYPESPIWANWIGNPDAPLRPDSFVFDTRQEMENFPLYEHYGETAGFWNCPNIAAAGGAGIWEWQGLFYLDFGYAYLGNGGKRERNWPGWGKEPHAPWGPEAPPDWALISDHTYTFPLGDGSPGTVTVGHVEGGGGVQRRWPTGQAAPRASDPLPEGGNQAHNDGSVEWNGWGEMTDVWVLGGLHTYWWVYK